MYYFQLFYDNSFVTSALCIMLCIITVKDDFLLRKKKNGRMFSGAVDTETNCKKIISYFSLSLSVSYLSCTCYILSVIHVNA